MSHETGEALPTSWEAVGLAKGRKARTWARTLRFTVLIVRLRFGPVRGHPRPAARVVVPRVHRREVHHRPAGG